MLQSCRRPGCRRFRSWRNSSFLHLPSSWWDIAAHFSRWPQISSWSKPEWSHPARTLVSLQEKPGMIWIERRTYYPTGRRGSCLWTKALPPVSTVMPSHVWLVIRGSFNKYFDTKSFSSLDFIVSNWASVGEKQNKMGNVSGLGRPETNTDYELLLQQPTHALADFLGLLHAVRAVVVEFHVEGVTMFLVLHPVWPPVALRATIGLWGGLQSGSWVITAQKSNHSTSLMREFSCGGRPLTPPPRGDGILLWEGVVTVVL